MEKSEVKIRQTEVDSTESRVGRILLFRRLSDEDSSNVLNLWFKQVGLLLIQNRYRALWFITAPLLGECICYLVIRIMKNQNILDVFILTTGIVGFLYARAFAISLPWNIDLVPIVLFFIYSGYRLKTILERIRTFRFSNKLILFALAVILNLVFSYINYHLAGNRIDFFYSRFRYEFLFILGAFLGVLR